MAVASVQYKGSQRCYVYIKMSIILILELSLASIAAFHINILNDDNKQSTADDPWT
jgi:hypothetical protein